MTTVTEIDRVAAANAISEHEGGWSRHCQQIVDGNADWDHVVQALSSHRIAAFEAGRVAGLEEAATLCNERGIFEQGAYGLNRAAQNYYRARDCIRALKEKSDGQ